jgi:hypothetical protein
MFPGCMIVKPDESDLQGVPDIFVLYEHKWAALEVKRGPTSRVQPNQEYYVERLNHMSFSAFIYPENEEEVLRALQQAFEPPRRARVSVA